MKITINTSPKSVELVNMILARSVESIEENPKLLMYFNITEKDVENIKKFRQALLQSFLNTGDEEFAEGKIFDKDQYKIYALGEWKEGEKTNDKFFDLNPKIKIAVISDSKKAYNGFLQVDLKTSAKHTKFIHIEDNDIERLKGFDFEKVFILKAHTKLFHNIDRMLGFLKYMGAKEVIYI